MSTSYATSVGREREETEIAPATLEGFWHAVDRWRDPHVVGVCNAQQCYYFRVAPRPRDSDNVARFDIASLNRDQEGSFSERYRWRFPSNFAVVLSRLIDEGYRWRVEDAR